MIFRLTLECNLSSRLDIRVKERRFRLRQLQQFSHTNPKGDRSSSWLMFGVLVLSLTSLKRSFHFVMIPLEIGDLDRSVLVERSLISVETCSYGRARDRTLGRSSSLPVPSSVSASPIEASASASTQARFPSQSPSPLLRLKPPPPLQSQLELALPSGSGLHLHLSQLELCFLGGLSSVSVNFKSARVSKNKGKAKVAANKGTCFHYGKDGHWKRNCFQYLASLKANKGKKPLEGPSKQ
ncbi:hypothetical protein CRG98_002682 [Punica granatum]|uniref:CCHC-type domain-containing protein n=1 Tax=Punica granatum TaxID=22663 RepID=A0A2I0L880_PUNGR|nr:hypothetical protein CRG98_002682 [Punica granatum]